MGDPPVTAPMRAFYRHPLFRLLIGLGGVIGAMMATDIAWAFLVNPLALGPWGEVMESLVLVVAAMVAYAAFVRGMEGRPVAEFGRAGAAREWAVGVALGLGAISLTVGVIAMLGGYRVTGTNPASVLVPVLALAIFSGVFEEIIARGLVFRLLEQWLGTWTALALSSS